MLNFTFQSDKPDIGSVYIIYDTVSHNTKITILRKVIMLAYKWKSPDGFCKLHDSVPLHSYDVLTTHNMPNTALMSCFWKKPLKQKIHEIHMFRYI